MALTDVRDIEWTAHHGALDLISGGPPAGVFGEVLLGLERKFA